MQTTPLDTTSRFTRPAVEAEAPTAPNTRTAPARDDEVDAIGLGSFPAGDPPSWWSG